MAADHVGQRRDPPSKMAHPVGHDHALDLDAVALTAPTLFSPKSNGPNVDNQRQGGSLGLKR